ncbi:MAG: hypothetical protein COA32_13870 [Fluviicola sp.]|nr:MAG: hypothetical protein COA32_13870 [Fluviicola sp.]
MKTLFTFISICLTGSIILTSCGTVSITKRKHSNGYHVYHNNIKQSSNISKSDNKFLNPTENNEVTELPPKKSEPLTLSGDEISSQTDETNNKNIQDKESIEDDEAVKNKSKQKAEIPRDVNKTDLAKDSHKTKSNLKESSLKETANKIKKTVTDTKLMKSSTSAEGALSLFWIIILIILILWLLGYLGGVIGNLIHLLLVVALILLILWLLRVI